MDVAALVVNALATAVMVGVVWFVQVVHYPLLARYGAADSPTVSAEHQRRTGWVVGLPMVAEGVTTLVLLVTRPPGVAAAWPWVGAVLLAVALGSTVVFSVPAHARMASVHDPAVGRRLVRTNWPRTVAWTLRLAVGAVMLAEALG